MSADGGRSIRAFRPSRYGVPDDESDEAEIIRLANLETYAKRASAGLPIFEEPAQTTTMRSRPEAAR